MDIAIRIWFQILRRTSHDYVHSSGQGVPSPPARPLFSPDSVRDRLNRRSRLLPDRALSIWSGATEQAGLGRLGAPPEIDSDGRFVFGRSKPTNLVFRPPADQGDNVRDIDDSERGFVKKF